MKKIISKLTSVMLALALLISIVPTISNLSYAQSVPNSKVSNSTSTTTQSKTVSNISNLKATSTTAIVKLSWKKAKYATGYEVWMYNPLKKAYDKEKVILDKNTNYCTIKYVPSATVYKFRVRTYRVINGVKYYSKFSYISSTTKPLTPKVTATAGIKKVTLAWTNTTVQNAGYEIYRATKKTGNYKKIKTTTLKTYTDTNLTKGKYYYYKVRAYTFSNTGKTVYGSFSRVKIVRAK